MQPQDSHQSVPNTPQQPSASNPLQVEGSKHSPPSLSSDDITALVTAQAKQLIEQYGSQPFALNSNLQQLKAKYLADNFHIIPNTAEN